MDKVLIIGLLTIAGVITVLILLSGMQTSIEETSDQTKESQKQSNLTAQTIIEIVNVRSKDRGTSLDVWIKNKGVVVVDLYVEQNLELFLADVEGNWGDYIRYSSTGPVTGENSWSLAGPPGQTWTPGVTLHLNVSLQRNPVSAGAYNLTINTPGNVTATHRFDASPN